MAEFNSIGKILAVFGIILFLTGIIFMLSGKVPWFGRLPGDIYIHKKNFTFFFPITTSLLISIVISAIFLLLRRR